MPTRNRPVLTQRNRANPLQGAVIWKRDISFPQCAIMVAARVIAGCGQPRVGLLKPAQIADL